MDQRLEGFEDYLRQCARNWHVPGLTVGVVEGDRVVYSGGVGCRDVEHELPVTAQGRFGIQSCTKSFTAAAVGILVQQGLLEWDRPVRDYCPRFRMYDPIASASVTFRDILCHRTGMPNGGHDWLTLRSSFANDELLSCLQYLEPSQPFRSGFQYSNIMYAVAGALIEEITGRSWEETIDQHIFLRLGMHSSNYSYDETDYEAMIDYLYESNSLIRASSRSDPDNDALRAEEYDLRRACGGIVSTIDDMCRWLQSHLTPAVFSPKTLRELHSAEVPCPGIMQGPELEDGGVAPGWFTQKYRGRDLILHWGVPAGPTVTSVMPEEGLGVVVHSNRAISTLHAINAAMLNAYDRMLGLEEISWLDRWQDTYALEYLPSVPEPKTREPVCIDHDKYVGSYCHPAYGRIELTEERGGLRVGYARFTFELEPKSMECFDMALTGKVASVLIDFWGRREIRVAFDPDGDAKTIEIPFEPSVSSIRFGRIQ